MGFGEYDSSSHLDFSSLCRQQQRQPLEACAVPRECPQWLSGEEVREPPEALAVREPPEMRLGPCVGKPPWRSMATHSSILAWRTSWTEEPGGLQSIGSQRDRTEELSTHTRAVPLV